MSSLRRLFGEDVSSNGPATAATPTKGDIVVPWWDVLVSRCSAEPMIVETAPPPPCPGKYLRFPRASSTCTSLYLRSRSTCAWHLCHYGLPIIIILLLIAFLQRRRLLTNIRILNPWILLGLTLCSAFLGL